MTEKVDPTSIYVLLSAYIYCKPCDKWLLAFARISLDPWYKHDIPPIMATSIR